jgi:hypothetical protein
MEQSPPTPREAKKLTVVQRVKRLSAFNGTNMVHYRVHKSLTIPTPNVQHFVNDLHFYGELVAIRPAPRLQDHPLLAVH